MNFGWCIIVSKMIKVVISRSQDSIQGGGEDRTTLHDLLEEAGYRGIFNVSLYRVTEDDYEPVLKLPDVTV